VTSSCSTDIRPPKRSIARITWWGGKLHARGAGTDNADAQPVVRPIRHPNRLLQRIESDHGAEAKAVVVGAGQRQIGGLVFARSEQTSSHLVKARLPQLVGGAIDQGHVQGGATEPPTMTISSFLLGVGFKTRSEPEPAH
jgi:hypothetical protein